jgi:hypothetical protein
MYQCLNQSRNSPEFYGTRRFVTLHHNIPPIASILSQINPFHFVKINFNIIIQSMLRYWKWTPLVHVSHHNPARTSFLSHARHSPPPPSPPKKFMLLDLTIRIKCCEHYKSWRYSLRSPFLPPVCYFLYLCSNCLPQHPILVYSESILLFLPYTKPSGVKVLETGCLPLLEYTYIYIYIF